MPNYLGQGDINGVPVWRFGLDDGSEFPVDDPMMAMEMGAPVNEPMALAPAANALPDMRTATVDMNNPNLQVTGAPPGPETAQDFQPLTPQAEARIKAEEEAKRREAAAKWSPDQVAVAGSATAPMTPNEQARYNVEADAARRTGVTEGTPDPELAQPVNAPAQPGADTSQAYSADPKSPYYLPPPSRYKRVASQKEGWRDTTRSVKGNPELQSELMATEDQLALQRLDTQRQKFATESAILETRRAEEAQKALDYEKKIEDTQTEVAIRRRFRDEQMKPIEEEEQKIAGMTVDHSRYFREDPGAALFAALMIGLGQFGASLNGGPNAAKQIIDQYIDADVANQKEEIAAARLKNEKANNALQRIMDEGGDPKFAEEKLKAYQQAYSASLMSQKDMQELAQRMGVNSMEVGNAIMADYVDRKAKMGELASVEANQKWQNAVRGGLVEKSYKEYIGEVSAWAAGEQQLGELDGTRLSPQERLFKAQQEAKDKEEQKGTPVNQRREKFGAALQGAGIPKMRSAIKGVREAVLSATDEDGDISGVSGLDAIIKRGSFLEYLMSDEGRAVRRQFDNLKDVVLRDRTGAAAAAAEKAGLGYVVEGDLSFLTSYKDLDTGLKIFERELNEQELGLAATYGPDARKAYYENLGEVPLGTEVEGFQITPADVGPAAKHVSEVKK